MNFKSWIKSNVYKGIKKIKTLFSSLKFPNLNTIVAANALLLSACALYISVQEVRIMRVQQKATMFPYLTITKTYNSEGYGIIIKNSGNGLAKINSYQVYNDSIHFRDWFDVLQNLSPESKIDYSMINTVGSIQNEMITPNEKLNLIFLRWNDETRLFENNLSSLKVKICYSSLLGESWMVTDDTTSNLVDNCSFEIEKEFGL
ncbi:hypothetical protein [Maribacter sp. IgM3_T14_3]|uniref:hypothetical protein n=1 Tax=Maribacter sp. IgM3_T14_3 TaxID=3415140 RepID=UPI003C6F4DE8